ncbi:MAG: hypothetical protein ACI96W_001160 [Paraglaciecola sp.]|jgi:hypothetical protein
MSQLPWVLYTDQSLEQGRFLGKLEWVSMYPGMGVYVSGNGCLCIRLGKLEWVSMYPLCIRAGMGVYVSANDVSERSCSLF